MREKHPIKTNFNINFLYEHLGQQTSKQLIQIPIRDTLQIRIFAIHLINIHDTIADAIIILFPNLLLLLMLMLMLMLMLVFVLLLLMILLLVEILSIFIELIIIIVVVHVIVIVILV